MEEAAANNQKGKQERNQKQTLSITEKRFPKPGQVSSKAVPVQIQKVLWPGQRFPKRHVKAEIYHLKKETTRARAQMDAIRDNQGKYFLTNAASDHLQVEQLLDLHNIHEALVMLYYINIENCWRQMIVNRKAEVQYRSKHVFSIKVTCLKCCMNKKRTQKASSDSNCNNICQCLPSGSNL